MTDANSANDAEIRSQSKTLALVFLVAAMVIAATLAANASWQLVRELGGALDGAPWRAVLREVGLNLIGALPAVLLLLAVMAAQRVFERMSEGAIFTAGNAADIGRIGENMLWAAVAAIAIVPSLSNWVRGEHGGVAVDMHDWALLLGVLGVAVSLMGRVFGLAARIKAENEQIV